MMSPRERYQVDPVFHGLVDQFLMFLSGQGEGLITPTELREAVMLATTMYEAVHIRPIVRYKSEGLQGGTGGEG